MSELVIKRFEHWDELQVAMKALQTQNIAFEVFKYNPVVQCWARMEQVD